MLEQGIIKDLVKKIQIAPEQIVREVYEILVLKELAEAPFGKNLIFKGGTALRLAYNSPRFSEDLDFSLEKSFSFSLFKETINGLVKKIEEIKIDDIYDKHHTIFTLLKIKEDFLQRSFAIKVEISKRSNPPRADLRVLSSSVSPLQVFIKVASAKAIFKDKLLALKTRAKPRDIFDLWFLSQKLNLKMPSKVSKFSKTRLKQELNKLLPKNYQFAVEQLSQKYAL